MTQKKITEIADQVVDLTYKRAELLEKASKLKTQLWIEFSKSINKIINNKGGVNASNNICYAQLLSIKPELTSDYQVMNQLEAEIDGYNSIIKALTLKISAEQTELRNSL